MNLVEKLCREVERVAVIREQYREPERHPAAFVRPAIALMDAAIEGTHQAAGGIEEIAVAIRELEHFTA
jgi:hypothetical protein